MDWKFYWPKLDEPTLECATPGCDNQEKEDFTWETQHTFSTHATAYILLGPNYVSTAST